MRRLFLPLFFLGVAFPMSVHGAALSPWVQGVLDTADRGKATAIALPTGSCSDPTVMAEIGNNLTLVRTLFTVADDLATESQFLRERTACFQNDRLLLIAKMKEILTELQTQTVACNQGGMNALRDVFRFLTESYQSFVRGAVDPGYEDPRLRMTHPFDSVTAWQSLQPSTPIDDASIPLCPFTTDYGPHALAYVPTTLTAVTPGSPGFDVQSYGCDAVTLRSLDPALQIETTALADFIDLSDGYARLFYGSVSQALQSIDTIVAVLTGVLPPQSATGVVPPPPHAKRDGCLRPPSPELSFVASANDTEETLLAFPDYFDAKHQREQTVAGVTSITYSPPPDQILPTWLLFRPTNDFFTSFPNVVNLSRAYTDQRALFGHERPLPENGMSAFTDLFALMRDLETVPVLESTSSTLERQSALIDAISRDAIERTDSASEPLRTAVRSLTFVVDDFLPKQYIPSFTFFLRRFCVDGHCSDTLDTVAKRIFNPYCHPYISGKYTEDDVPAKCYCQGKYASQSYCR